MNTLGTSDVVSDMNTLGTSTNVTNMANLNASGVVNNIATVAGAVTNVNNVGGSIGSVNTTAANISGVNSFAARYRVGSSDPSTSLDEGDLAYNTNANALKYYNGSAWVSIVAGSLTAIIQDTSPQLGGTLDTNQQTISTVSNRDVELAPNIRWRYINYSRTKHT